MIRFGILGTARVASYGLLAPARETEGVEVSAIASRDPGKAEAYAAENRIPRAFASYAALVEAPEIDAVYVALPTALHHEWAQRAIEAGKHVLCEKPLAATGDQAQALLEAAARRGVVLAEGMHVRHHAGLKRLRELTREGAVGRTLRIDSCFRTPYVPIAKDDFRLNASLGGGAGLDLGCYAVSCLRAVADEEPEILSVSHRLIRPQVDRWMRAELRFPSGLPGSVEFGLRGFYTPRDGVIVTGERGRMKWDTRTIKIEREGKVERLTFPPTPTYRLQLEAFARSVRGEPSASLPPEDSVATARVVDALYAKAGLASRAVQ